MVKRNIENLNKDNYTLQDKLEEQASQLGLIYQY